MLENVSIIIPLAPDEQQHKALLEDLNNTQSEVIISSEGTRAKSLNAGAAKAAREFLWFLHADSRVSADNLSVLFQSLQKFPKSLHYFDLAFEPSGLVGLNAWGANMRSRLFRLPYGDQGFCLSKDQFEKLGGYSEGVLYGEDMLFVRRARKGHIKLQPIPSKLYTSARKYKECGWGKLTLFRQYQLIKLLGHKV